MPTTLIFVRHGESEGNKNGRYNGQLNLPLSDIGKSQAEKTAEFLDKFKIDVIYSSDLSRAYDTALATSKRQNIPIISSKEIREIFGGKFEGLEYAKIKDIYPEEYNSWINDMANCQCPDGESVKDVYLRVSNKISDIVLNNKEKTVLIVTHGLPLRIMSTVWYKKSLSEIRDFEWMKNASVTVVNYDDINKPEVILYDEHSHLNDLITELPSNI